MGDVDTSTERVRQVARYVRTLDHYPSFGPVVADLLEALAAERDELADLLTDATTELDMHRAAYKEVAAVLARVPEDVRRLAEACIAIEDAGVLPEGFGAKAWPGAIAIYSNHVSTMAPVDGGPAVVVGDYRLIFESGGGEWSVNLTVYPTAVEAARAAVAAMGGAT